MFCCLQPAHFGLQDYWAVLKDPPAVVEIMEEIFGTKDFVCTEGGGDFNTPGAPAVCTTALLYTRLHTWRIGSLTAMLVSPCPVQALLSTRCVPLKTRACLFGHFLGNTPGQSHTCAGCSIYTPTAAVLTGYTRTSS
jgi:hypothetical protein